MPKHKRLPPNVDMVIKSPCGWKLTIFCDADTNESTKAIRGFMEEQLELWNLHQDTQKMKKAG